MGNYTDLSWYLLLVFWIIGVCFMLSIILEKNQSDYRVLLGKTVLYQQSIWGGREEQISAGISVLLSAKESAPQCSI